MKLDIRMLVPGLPIDGNDPFAHSLGGSETSGLQLASALAKLGHLVSCFATIEQPCNWEGVNLMPSSAFVDVQRAIPCDLSIVQRAPTAFVQRSSAKCQFLWVHDLLFARRRAELLQAMHSIDRVVTVSDFQKRQYQEVGGADLPDSLFMVSRNGIDVGTVAKAASLRPDREANLIVCAARPERGIDVLLTRVFPEILNRMPDARLALAGYDCPNPSLDGFYRQLQQVATSGQFGNRVEWHGALSKLDLYELYHRASLYLYPTPSPIDPSFLETACISAMEAMACGCPVMCSARGGLIETVGKFGRLVEFEAEHAAMPEVVEKFAEAAVLLLSNPHRLDRLRAAGIAHANGLGWESVAGQFVDEAVGIMTEQSSNPVRLARHFVRRQDIEAARNTCEAALCYPDVKPQTHFEINEAIRGEVEEFHNWLVARYQHTEDPTRLAAYYAEQVGPGNEHVFQGLMQAGQDRFNQAAFVRFDAIDKKLRFHLRLPQEGPPPDDTPPLRILDFGCSQGECPIVLSNRLGARVIGADASWSEVNRAGQLAKAKASKPELLTFVVATEVDHRGIKELVEEEGLLDGLVMAEVLEHVIDPIALLTKLEALVRPGGAVVLTMPYGPWETQQPEHLRGQHLREWDIADLGDVLGKKPGIIIDRMPLSSCPVSGEVLGNTIISFNADHAPFGSIDWDRKLRLQKPRQTLSACMLIGGAKAHETLHWCLSPVMEIADELVVSDAGMTDEARRIVAQNGGRVFEAPHPLREGFETARNIGLAQCRGDWVLMIDSDERLLTPANMWRYLRTNPYHSYALPQHHFAVDANWQPDLPGRLFRRGPDEKGRVLRFIGMLHEHAEFGANEGAGRALMLGDVRIAHVGYLDQMTRANRFLRNLPVLQRDLEKYPNRKLGLLVLCRDSVIQASYLLAVHGIDATKPGAANLLPQAANLCRDVLGVWERNFVDDNSMMAAAALEQYNLACKLLGTDVIAESNLSVSRQGVGSPIPINPVHFASVEHYRRHIQSRLEALTKPLAGVGY